MNAWRVILHNVNRLHYNCQTEKKGVKQLPNRANSHDLEKWFWYVGVRYLFYQPKDEKIKTWPLRFASNDNSNMEKAFFDWPIVLQYDVTVKYRKFSGMKFFHQRVRENIRFS